MSGIGDRLEGKRIMIVAGSGGVGKTTASAALALGLAAAGQRVAVVTIDPARRLADSLGLEELGNEPRLVDAAVLEEHGIEMRGELWAMMLDPKATFDGLIAKLAPDAATRDDVLGNRIYAQLSSAIAGSQEFSAVAKLYELDREGDYDAIVLDTPPSRNALDFLDAPDRLTDFFEGRALKLFLVPTGIAGRLLGARVGRRLRDPQEAHGREPARGHVGPAALDGRADRRLPRARGRGQGAAARPRHDVPHRRLARARAGRRGDLLPPEAARGADAVRRA